MPDKTVCDNYMLELIRTRQHVTQADMREANTKGKIYGRAEW